MPGASTTEFRPPPLCSRSHRIDPYAAGRVRGPSYADRGARRVSASLGRVREGWGLVDDRASYRLSVVDGYVPCRSLRACENFGGYEQ